jgi:glycosyltransferase involved in cell wall biosynthesis
MATGIPPVVTDVGDAAALLRDAGLVVPPRDPQAMGAALGQLVEMSEALRRELGRKARERVVSSYSVDSMLNAYAELYAGLVRSPSDAGQANRSPEGHTGTDVR